MNQFFDISNSTIKKLSGGLSNIIYLIDNKYIWKEIKNDYIFDHSNEVKIIKNLKNIDLYYHDSSNICYSFIKGSNIDICYFRKNLKNIILTCKNYHKNKLNLPNFWVDIIPRWINMLPNVHKNIYKTDIIKIYNKINSVTHIFNSDEIVLCHHDIHPGNIILNDKLNLIDLEFSFNNFIYVDLGNIICEYYTNYHDEEYNYNLINDNIKEKILEYYNLAKNKINLEKINIGIDISHLYWLIWGLLVDVMENKNGFDYIKFAKSRYECIKY